MLMQFAERRCWLLSKAMVACSSLGDALQLAKEAEAFLALADDAEVPALPATVLQPSTSEVVKAKTITAVADPEAQSTVVVASTEGEMQVTIIPEPSPRGAKCTVRAPSSSVVSSLSVFAVPEDVTRYLRRQGISAEATVTGLYEIAGRLEPLSVLQTRANALRAQQNLPPLELMPIPAARSNQKGVSRLGARRHPEPAAQFR